MYEVIFEPIIGDKKVIGTYEEYSEALDVAQKIERKTYYVDEEEEECDKVTINYIGKKYF